MATGRDVAAGQAAIRFHRGMAYFNLRTRNGRDLAIADFGAALELQRDFPAALVARGMAVLAYDDEVERAFRDFNRAIALDPTFYPAYWARGELADRQGDPASALADYKLAFELIPRGDDAANDAKFMQPLLS